MGITAFIETMTPARAEQILADQRHLEELSIQGALPLTKQRKIDDKVVRQYARTMQEGRWHLNGEPIQFNGGQRLLNGQHRLRAIVMADTPIDLLVVRGVPSEAFTSIDQGKPRTVANLLGMMGVAYQSEIASAARNMLVYEHLGTLVPAVYRPTRQEMVAFVKAWQPGLQDAASLASWTGIGHRAMLTTLAFLVRERPERAPFFEALKSGAGLAENSPILLLRNRLQGVHTSRSHVQGWWTFGIAAKAWNAYVDGRPMGILRFGRGEDYPIVSR